MIILTSFICGCYPNFLSSPQDLIEGNGSIIQEERDITPFEKIQIEDGLKLSFKQNVFIEKPKLSIQANENIMPIIQTEVQNLTLYIRTSNNKLVSPNSNKTIEVESKSLEQVSMFNQSNANLTEMTLRTFKSIMHDNSELHLEGQLKSFTLIANNTSIFNGSKLQVVDADIELNHQSKGTIMISDELKIKLSDNSQLTYKGSPEITKKVISSGSLLEKTNILSLTSLNSILTI